MKRLLKNCLLACVLALMPMSLAMAQDPAAEAVCTALAEGKSPGDIIAMLRAETFGMSLEDATATAMDACGDGSRTAFASAGIAAADNLVEAQAVASAVEAASAGDAQVSQAVEVAMAEYARLMGQPFIHHDDSIQTGGGAPQDSSPGVSPAS